MQRGKVDGPCTTPQRQSVSDLCTQRHTLYQGMLLLLLLLEQFTNVSCLLLSRQLCTVYLGSLAHEEFRYTSMFHMLSSDKTKTSSNTASVSQKYPL